MSHVTTPAQRRQMTRDNTKRSTEMVLVLPKDWPLVARPKGTRPDEVWRSRDFLAMVFNESSRLQGLTRISVCRTELGGDGRWNDGIAWDDLQAIKGAVGFGMYDAVEIYPDDASVVNVANMRHLWVMPLDIGWKW